MDNEALLRIDNDNHYRFIDNIHHNLFHVHTRNRQWSILQLGNEIMLFEEVRAAYPKVDLRSDDICTILQWYAISKFQHLDRFLTYYELITADDFFNMYNEIIEEYPPKKQWEKLFTQAQFIELVSDKRGIPLLYISDNLYLLKEGE